MMPICQVCGVKAEPADVWSEVRVNAERSESGHYLCVIKALGPEIALKAIQKGYLPFIKEEDLIDGKKNKKILEMLTKQEKPRDDLA